MKSYNQLPIRTVLHFSLRIDASKTPPDVVARIESAFGALFHDEEIHEISLREMYLLGMVIRFVPWRGIGLRKIYQLVGYTQVPLDHNVNEKLPKIDISSGIIDLLEAKGAGTWHVPTREELDAEGSSETSRVMEGEA